MEKACWVTVCQRYPGLLLTLGLSFTVRVPNERGRDTRHRTLRP